MDQHGQGLGVVQDMTAQSAETGAHDTGECHAIEEVTENGESSNATDVENGAAVVASLMPAARASLWTWCRRSDRSKE